MQVLLAIKRCFRITRLQESAGQATRVLWQGAKAANQRQRCHSSLVTSQRNGKMISNYRFKVGRNALSHFKLLSLGQQTPSCHLCPLPQLGIPGPLVAPEPTQYTIHDRLERFYFLFFFILKMYCSFIIKQVKKIH